jgi:hypothetical protein
MYNIKMDRGVNTSPRPPYCTPGWGICIIERIPEPIGQGGYDMAGFDNDGHFTIEFIDYDFQNDQWLSGSELVLEGDYVIPEELANELGGTAITIPAGTYQLTYIPEDNKKVVVFP